MNKNPYIARVVFFAVLCLGVHFLVTMAFDSSKQRRAQLFGVALHGYPITSQEIAGISGMISFVPAIVEFYLQWPETPKQGRFPLESAEAIWNSGSLPCITWEPMYIRDEKEFAIGAEKVLAGEYDLYIDEFARGAAAFGRPILIRFAHEMNLDRYHWGSEKSAYGPASPELYKSLYRYVVTRVRKTPGTKISWAFNPNAHSVPAQSWNAVKAYYPGDDVVDVLGMDGYSWLAPGGDAGGTGDPSFRTIFSSLYQDLVAISSKPILVFETATVGTDAYKKEWLVQAFETAQRWNLEGIVWFHADKEHNWTLPTFTPNERPFEGGSYDATQARETAIARLFK